MVPGKLQVTSLDWKRRLRRAAPVLTNSFGLLMVERSLLRMRSHFRSAKIKERGGKSNLQTVSKKEEARLRLDFVLNL